MTVVDVIVAIAMAAVVAFAVWCAVTYGRLVRQRHRVDLCGAGDRGRCSLPPTSPSTASDPTPVPGDPPPPPV